MSGTSLDGVDASVVDFSADRAQVLAGAHLPFEPRLLAGLPAPNPPGSDEIHPAAWSGPELARCYHATAPAPRPALRPGHPPGQHLPRHGRAREGHEQEPAVVGRAGHARPAAEEPRRGEGL